MELTFDPRPTTPTALDRQHDNYSRAKNRRGLLKLGLVSIVVSQTGRLLHSQSAPQFCAAPYRRITRHPTVALAHIPFPGSTRMVITTKARCGTSNYPTSIITSMVSWRAAMVFTAWVRTIRAIVSPGALPRPTTATLTGEYWAARQAHQAIFAHT
jgi:hypothetical protein